MKISPCVLRSNGACLRPPGGLSRPVEPLLSSLDHAGRCGVMRSPMTRKNTKFSWRAKSQEGKVDSSRIVFQTSKEKTFLQGILSEVPNGLAYAAAVGLVAISGLLGYTLGSKTEGNMRNAYRALGTLVGVGCAAKVAGTLKESRESGASIDLYNLLVAKDDPDNLQETDVDAIRKKYGVETPNKLSSELKSIYDEYLTSMIPQGVALVGDEPEKVAGFKRALGITDEDAAAVHLDVGRRLRRVAVESEGKNAGADAKKTFQKWIYISYRVFGEEKAAFLLPVRRIFGVTESQIMVARRDNAKSIFRTKIDELGGTISSDRHFLQDLRKFQRSIMLKDEVASQVIKEVNLNRVENALRKALKSVRDRSRNKDEGIPMQEMQGILSFNREMEGLALEKENDLLPPGLGRVTIHGGDFEKDVSSADRRELYRTFLEERMALDGQITVILEKDLDDLSIVLALGTKEAESIREESASKMYRKLLRDEVQSGRLDSAASKATILQQLCDRVRFKPEHAAVMHKNIYKQKIEGILDSDKKISDEKNQELVRLRKLMCIPEKDVEDVMLETVGGLLKEAINDALSAGVDGFCDQDKKNVRQAMEELRADQKMAKTVLDQSARQAFLKYISQSRLKPNKLAAAKELKSMVMFSNSVVAPLLEEIKEFRLLAAAPVRGNETCSNVDKGNSEAEKAAAQAEFEEILAEAKRKAAEEVIAEGEDSGAVVAEQDDVQIIPDNDDTTKPDQEVTEESEGIPSSLKKSKQGADSFKEVSDERKVKELSQKEINLANDLETRDGVDIYRNYLIYCMTGDVMAMPMGGTVVLERDVNEFGRLSQLGDILGLSPMDIMKVHTDMAEDAYRNQVKAILADGMITKEKTDSLTDVREKLGLTKEQGEKIVKGVQTEALAQSMQSAKAMGDLDLQKILDMKESGVEIDSFTSVQFRKSLFQKEAIKAMSDGKGNFDEEYMTKQLPEDLLIDKDQAQKILKEAAGNKAKLLTVQAMSDLRMKNFDNAIQDVNNLLVCTKIVGSDSAPKWDRKEEIMDLFSVYYWKVKDEQKVSGVQHLFSISDSDAESLKQSVDSGGLSWAQEVQQEDEIFF